MAGAGGPINMDAVTAQVKRLINAQLKQVCKGAGLQVSGAKAALQTRIISQLQYCANNGNYDAFNRLKTLVYNPDIDSNTSSSSSSSASTRPYISNNMQPHSPYQNTFGPNPPGSVTSMSKGHNPSNTFELQAKEKQKTEMKIGAPLFKVSPFYSLVEPLTPILECKVRESTRDTVQTTINLRQDIVDRLNSGSARAMVYCAADSTFSPFTRVDIAFPYQVEIKINQDEVKSNLRGLKGKPGSTRPADITDLLRKRAGYNNEMMVNYALTKTRFFMIVNLVERIPVNALVSKLKAGKTISKDRVLREMSTRAEDADIVATSSIMSLKCPLSTLRIDVPCRSTVCNHNQCFDAASFLQLQEQGPTWTCPVCNKGVSFEHLQIDQYVDEILRKTPKTVDQVTIEPTGKWSTKTEAQSSPKTSNRDASSDADDDLIEIQEVPRVSSIKTEGPHEPNMLRTPPFSSREPSTSSGPQASVSNKRPAPQIVDLTLSSDEDDEPIRAPKRQNTSGQSHEFPDTSIVNQMPIRSNGVLPTASYQPSQPSNPFMPPGHYQSMGYGRPP